MNCCAKQISCEVQQDRVKMWVAREEVVQGDRASERKTGVNKLLSSRVNMEREHGNSAGLFI
jgi:hypothetical protein